MKLRIDCVDFSYQEATFSGEEYELVFLVNDGKFIKLEVEGDKIYVNSSYIMNFMPLDKNLKVLSDE